MKGILKKVIPRDFIKKAQPSFHLLETAVARAYYKNPAKNLRIIGVTGTNGKTSTSFMIFNMLKEAGLKVGLLSTVAYGVGDDIVMQDSHVTTASGPRLQKQISDIKNTGAEWLVLETTSHALAQNRVFGLNFEVAVLTNVTHEHLDYHGTFKKYTREKLKLFTKTAQHENGFAVINADDKQAKIFTNASKKYVTYGMCEGKVKACDLQLTPEKSKFLVCDEYFDDTSFMAECNIAGDFNVMNSLATICVGKHLKLSQKQVVEGLAKTKQIAGRMSKISMGQDFSVIIDFAHTPDSFELLLRNAASMTSKKLIVVFGSAGRRDLSKRFIQGEIAGKYADVIVLTEEDDRDEDGEKILSQIEKGVLETMPDTKKLFKILDREQAIKKAVSLCEKDDTILFLGKGHEKTIERIDGEHYWNEEAVVKKAISQKMNS